MIIDDFFVSILLQDKSTLKDVIHLLSSTNENTVISTLTTLFYLCDHPQAKQRIFLVLSIIIDIMKKSVQKAIQTYADCDNCKLSNIAKCIISKLNS